MKVVFLDIDGVMNSANRFKQLQSQGLLKNNPMWDLPYEDTLKALKKIIDETGAKIVLSSSWRLTARVKELEDVFKSYDLFIFGKTCRYVSEEEMSKMDFDLNMCYSCHTDKNGDKYTSDRGAEIAWWLHQHPEVENFVILDDESTGIEPYYKKGKNFVKTDFYNWGLTMELAEKAIYILTNKEEHHE